MVSGGMTCVKYLLFVFNLVFFLAGLGLVALGAVAYVKFNEYSILLGEEGYITVIFLILTGAVVFIISFFGCAGAYKENYCMIYTYSILLGFILLLEIVAVLVAYSLNIQFKLEQSARNKLADYKDHKHTIVTEFWDRIQKELQCCGVHGQRDWLNNPILNKTLSVPDACCVKEAIGCGKELVNDVNATAIYTEGCFNKVVFLVGEHSPIIRGAVAGLAVFELLCIVFACCLARSIHREYESVAGMSKC